MTGEATHIESTFSARARDALLLKGAERAVRSFTPEQHAIVRKYFDAAQRRASVADDLSDDRNAAVAYVLYREAVTLLISAVTLSRRPAEAPRDAVSPTAAFERLEALSRGGHIPELPPFIAAAKNLLSVDEPLAFDRRAPEDLLSQRRNVEQTLRWLSDLIEPRTLNEIRATRFVRLFMIGAVLCGCLVWAVMRVTRPKNLALGKPVSASSQHPQTAAPKDNSGVTNGDVESAYGIATNPPASSGGLAWVMVDLTQPTRFKRIKIYNRADGWFDDPLPLTLELSDDATNFNAVDTRSTSFSARSPWVYEPAGGGQTRYIRVRSSTNLVAINEIEVNP
jgi:hypothetical protein